MERRLLLLGAVVLVLVASVVRIRYQEFGWGGYWYVDIVPPWR